MIILNYNFGTNIAILIVLIIKNGQKMKLERKSNEKGSIIVDLEGELDAEGSIKIRKALENIALADTADDIVFLDLFKVNFIDSSGIGTIVFLFKQLKENNRQLKIIGVHGQPREILELLRIHKAIPVELVDGEIPLTVA